jgi:DNA-binding response OmpR family regulator
MMTKEGTQARDHLVMIIDDDGSILDFLEFIVKKEGFKVERASDGEEELSKIRKLMPDLVILDFMLPHYGGFEVLRELQRGETAAIPIVVITGRYTDGTAAEIINQESNVIGFLEKPIKPQALGMLLYKILKVVPPKVVGGARTQT